VAGSGLVNMASCLSSCVASVGIIWNSEGVCLRRQAQLERAVIGQY